MRVSHNIMLQHWPTHNLFGTPIGALTMQEVLSVVDNAIEHRDQLLIGVVNAAKIVNMRRDEQLERAVRSADLILADGMAVVWAGRLLGRRLPERVPGIDLMTRMLQRSHERGYRIFLLGATKEVLATVAQRIVQDYPNALLVGQHDGYFSGDEESTIAASIAAAKPDILFAAMSSPKKECFLARWSTEMDVPVCHGVGGAFDVLAGIVHRAPQRWQRLGLEWLYRVKQEPRRLWRRYLVTNSLFTYMLLRELVLQLRPKRKDLPFGAEP